MDKDIELNVYSCLLCQENQKYPSKAPIHPWEWTQNSWSRLHINFADPFQGQIFYFLLPLIQKVLFLGQIFENEILMYLHISMSPESENHIF